MISTSVDANTNYLAKVVEITTLNPHPNADKLQIATICFQPVIVGIDMKVWEKWVYVPVESQLEEWFLHINNMYEDKSMNKNTEIKWYINKRSRVRAVKLRWEKSMGLFITESQFKDSYWIELPGVWETFDTVLESTFVRKYIPPAKHWTWLWSQGKKPVASRMIDGNFHLHVDTSNLRYYVSDLKLDDVISITYKLHWTSAVFANCKVLKKLSAWQRILKFFWWQIDEKEDDIIYSSRRVVKNRWYSDTSQSFYDTDVWKEVASTLTDTIPKWYAIYGEIVGYQSTWAWIQWDYDYGCIQWEKDFYWYRLTFNNWDGLVYNIDTPTAWKMMQSWWIKTPEIYFNWKVSELLKVAKIDESTHWQEALIKYLEKRYNWNKCHICKNAVPAEGIILRKETHSEFTAYKLKCKDFLLYETKQLDEQDDNDKVTTS